MNTALRLTAGLALALLLPWAQAADNSVCRADAKALCAGVKPGGGRLVTCLQSHEAQLSPACKTQLPTLARCADVIQQQCPDAKPRALRTCMAEHKADIGPECAALAHP